MAGPENIRGFNAVHNIINALDECKEKGYVKPEGIKELLGEKKLQTPLSPSLLNSYAQPNAPRRCTLDTFVVGLFAFSCNHGFTY